MTEDFHHPPGPGAPVIEPTLRAPDEMHVVPPSWQPLLLAVGLTLTLAGIAVTPVMWMVGTVLSISAIVNWLTELRRDYHTAGHDESGVPDG